METTTATLEHAKSLDRLRAMIEAKLVAMHQGRQLEAAELDHEIDRLSDELMGW